MTLGSYFQHLTRSLNKRYFSLEAKVNNFYQRNKRFNQFNRDYHIFALKAKQQVRCNDLQQQVDGLTHDLNTTKAQMQVTEQRYQEQQNELNTLKAQVQVIEQRYQEQQSELNALKALVQILIVPVRRSE
jgi:chromosome segregation ATPase